MEPLSLGSLESPASSHDLQARSGIQQVTGDTASPGFRSEALWDRPRQTGSPSAPCRSYVSDTKRLRRLALVLADPFRQPVTGREAEWCLPLSVVVGEERFSTSLTPHRYLGYQSVASRLTASEYASVAITWYAKLAFVTQDG